MFMFLFFEDLVLFIVKLYFVKQVLDTFKLGLRLAVEEQH